MDIAEFFKEMINKNYKKKKSLLGRKQSLISSRRETRDTLRFNNRKIDVNMSPMTPLVPAKKAPEAPVPKKDDELTKRLQLLKEWKQQRNKKKEEDKKKAKPVFKVFHVNHQLGLPDLENINKEIKGKPIKRVNSNMTNSFAPAKHAFVAPKQIKPIQFNKETKQPLVNKPVKSKTQPSSSRSTRSNLSNKTDKVSSNNAKKVLSNAAPMVKKMISDTTNNAVRLLPRVARTGIAGKIVNKVTSNLAKNNLKVVPTTKPAKDPKTRPIRNNMIEQKKVLPKEPLKPKKSDSLKANKSVGWSVVSIDDGSHSVTPEEKEGKKYQKTPRKPSLRPALGNLTPLDVKLKKAYAEFTKESEFVTPPAQATAVPVDTPYTPSASTPIEEISIISIDDSTDENKLTIIYDDGEVTLQTPGRKRHNKRTPSQTPKRRASRRVSIMKNSCKFCPNSSEKCCQDKTPSAESKTPTARAKTPKSATKRKSAIKNDLEIPIETVPSSLKKMRTPRPGRKTKKNQEEKEEEKTPTSEKVIPTYISPFVTISRGKESARKEYQIRKSTGGTFMTSPDGKDYSDSTSPKAGAEYFEKLLAEEIEKIEEMCSVWEKYRDETQNREETSDMINVAVGQSRLLVAKKFEQFRKLIVQCKTCDYEEKPITCEDLHGFWDMIYQQVIDLNKRFDNLERLKKNNWEEILPEKKVVQKKGRGRPKKQPVATSSLKEMIKAARNKKKPQNDCEPAVLEDTTNFSPSKTNNSRMSLRVSLLRGPTIRRLSSPGLTMMKITQAIKSGDGLTPSKSILKSESKSTTKGMNKKSVLFVDHFDKSVCRKVGFSPEDKENWPKQADSNEKVDLNNSFTVRRSKRISKTS